MAEEPRYVTPSIASELVRVKHSAAIEKREPAKAAMAMEMLAAGNTYDQIKEATGFGLSAIAGLRARHEVALDERRKQLAADGLAQAEGLRLLAQKKMEQLANDPEALAKTNIRDLVISGAITQDKVFAALGENKVVLEHRSKGPSLEDAMAAIAEARAKIKAAAVEVVVSPSVETNA